MSLGRTLPQESQFPGMFYRLKYYVAWIKIHIITYYCQFGRGFNNLLHLRDESGSLGGHHQLHPEGLQVGLGVEVEEPQGGAGVEDRVARVYRERAEVDGAGGEIVDDGRGHRAPPLYTQQTGERTGVELRQLQEHVVTCQADQSDQCSSGGIFRSLQQHFSFHIKLLLTLS